MIFSRNQIIGSLILLFVILHLLWRRESIRAKPGILTGAFWIGYGVFRIVGKASVSD